ncbi:hypothetical protein PoB_002808000 [Plakobranchus ocellatus]|uniref:Uncharacterized protein n=1 Tax=Plakobranchus ocellatus TaxID=259542 RepID=A0AAV4A3Z1_9GAST|nr:hypothetical protein PoB_002808000 [Plakobranchus ocellatus]
MVLNSVDYVEATFSLSNSKIAKILQLRGVFAPMNPKGDVPQRGYQERGTALPESCVSANVYENLFENKWFCLPTGDGFVPNTDHEDETENCHTAVFIYNHCDDAVIADSLLQPRRRRVNQSAQCHQQRK